MHACNIPRFHNSVSESFDEIILIQEQRTEMGNCFSHTKQSRGQAPNSRSVSRGVTNDPSGDNDGAEPRSVGSGESITANIGQFEIRYGYLSQRGFYPDGE